MNYLVDAVLQLHHEITTEKGAKQQIKDALKTFKVTMKPIFYYKTGFYFLPLSTTTFKMLHATIY